MWSLQVFRRELGKVTYLDKARELRPDLSRGEIDMMCPNDFGLTEVCCELDTCEECWYREFPVEVKK